MKSPGAFFSFTLLLAGPVLFGLLQQPAEMGLTIVAGALGLAFSNLEKFARFRGAGFEAELRTQVEAIVAKETEPPVDELPSTAATEHGLRMEAYGLVGNEAPKIVRALLNPKFTWRYVSGISKESGCTSDEVEKILDWLQKNELARSFSGALATSWALTPKGRAAFTSLRAEA